MEKVCCVYKITNEVNGRFYIGRSKNLKKRWERHKEDMNKKNLPLYVDMREYGFENFSLSVIEMCEEEQLDEKELFYYNKLKPDYNILTPGENPMYNEVAKKTFDVNYHSEEAKEKRSESLKKRWLDESYRQKMIQTNSKPCSEKRKKAISKGKKNKKRVIMCDLETKKEISSFESISEAKRFLRDNGYPKADCTPISNVCKGKTKKAYDKFWKFEKTQTTIQ
jgi:group I intron endonuclease